MSIVNGSLQNARATTAAIAASSAVPLDGQIVYNSQTGQYKIGDGVTTLSALSYYGGSGALTIGTTTITSGTNTRILYNNNGVVGEYTVTGTGTTAVLSTSPVFGTDITTPLINPSTFLNVGNAAVAGGSLSKMRVGLGTSFVDIGQSASGIGAIWINQATPLNTNSALSSDGAYTIINAVSNSMDLRFNNNSRILFTNTAHSYNVGNTSSGAVTAYTWTPPTSTGQTATSNIANFDFLGATKTWATGTVALQYFNRFRTNTTAAAAASNFTVTGNLVVDYVQGGTNATNVTSAAIYVPTLALTNTTTGIGLYVVAPSGATTNYAARFDGNMKVISGTVGGENFQIRDLIGTSNYMAIYGPTTTNSATNYALSLFAEDTNFNCGSSGTMRFQFGATTYFSLTSLTLGFVNGVDISFGTGAGTKLGKSTTQKLSFWNATPIVQPTNTVAINDVLTTTGLQAASGDTILFNSFASTGLSAGVNTNSFKVTGSTKQWATGALATQYFNYFSANTVAFAGASTATNVYGLYVEAATAGTNATITNNYAAGFGGVISSLGLVNFPSVAYGYELKGRTDTAFSVPYFRPTTTNTVCALDLFPNGSPSESAGNGYTWIDLCDTDDLVNVGAARLGMGSAAAYVGSQNFGSASVKPFQIRVGGTTVMTFDASRQAVHIDNTVNGTLSSYVSNPSTGTAALARIYAINSVSHVGLYQFSTSFTTSGMRIANWGTLLVDSGAAGLNIGTEGATAVQFWTNSVKRGEFKSGGNFNAVTGYEINGVAGVDGTFVSADAKTVTVSKGLITAIV